MNALKNSSPQEFRFSRNGQTLVMGRDPGSDIRVGGIGVSRNHAFLRLDTDHIVLEDNGSSSGVFLNGEKVSRALVGPGDTITVGVWDLGIQIDASTIRIHPVQRDIHPAATHVEDSDQALTRIGRDTDNDIHINHPLISRHHAQLHRPAEGATEIVDLGTTNGTFVNGRSVHRAPISAGDIIQIGPYRFSLGDNGLVQADDCNRISLSAENVVVYARGSHLLRGIDLSIAPGEFVALLGPSGAGKTTLANALAGRVRIRSGEVRFNGLPLNRFLSAFSSRIGFVTQSNLLHAQLTVWETFAEQSVLRLPSDSIPAERNERIREIVDLLDLGHTLDRRVGMLSGGEQKRVHLGIELLASPPVVFLDEPMAGLDSSLIRMSMKLFRKVCDKGHTLLVTTHTLEHIELCDRVVFLNKGQVAYDGAPGGVCGAFEVQSLTGAYEAVRKGKTAGEPGKQKERTTVPNSKMPGAPMHLTRPKIIHPARQSAVLIPRFAKLWVRDGKNAVLVLAQAPLIAVLLALVYRHDASFLPASFYFSAAISAIWCGGTLSVREIAREWPLFDREYRAGVSSVAYGLSKISVFGIIGLVQGVFFAVSLSVVFETFAFNAANGAILTSASVLGVLLGLCVSTLSPGVAHAVSFLPLIFIPQIFFSGILVAFDRMAPVGRFVSHLTISRPVFSLFKKTALLDQSPWSWQHWHMAFWLGIGSIILILSGLTVRRFFERW